MVAPISQSNIDTISQQEVKDRLKSKVCFMLMQNDSSFLKKVRKKSFLPKKFLPQNI